MFLLNKELIQVSELKPVWSKSPAKEKDRPIIKSSLDIFNVLFPCYPQIDMYESFWVMLLSRGNRIKAVSNISIGSCSGTVADPKKIFQMALLANASALVLIHNHPSGNLRPSSKDIEVTRKCVTIGQYLDLPVLDHLIISPEQKYFSFADEQILH